MNDLHAVFLQVFLGVLLFMDIKLRVEKYGEYHRIALIEIINFGLPLVRNTTEC